MKITKAVIMVAGWGTRMLPITKSIEKCMLPIGNRPMIDFVVRDIIAAGIKDIYFVVGEQSTQLQSYYRTNIGLNDYLKRQGKTDYLPLVAPLRDVSIHFLTQPGTGKYGTSIPVAIASEFIDEDESAVVIYGDSFFYRSDGGSCIRDLIDATEQAGVASALTGNPVPRERIPLFGIIEKDEQGNFVRIVEKPTIEEAPSNLNNSGYFILHKDIFRFAETLPPDERLGEYLLTDAINEYVSSGEKMVVVEMDGEYMECGSVDGWLHANNVIVGTK